MKQPKVAVIIVTHNSKSCIDKNLACLQQQTNPPNRIVVVDSGSQDRHYLSRYQGHPTITLVFAKGNIGFCQGNNLGLQYLPDQTDYLLFLNPDCFLPVDFLQKATAIMQDPQHDRVGMLSGILLGYDLQADRPTGHYDSTGIFQTWYGHWFDRDQGRDCADVIYENAEQVPALCGALLFCRLGALKEVALRQGEVFDGSFFMYKEDIELSLRMRAKGWQLLVDPSLTAWHCRGWKSRREVSRRSRLLSAKNEWRLHRRQGPVQSLYSLTKYCAVYLFDW